MRYRGISFPVRVWGLGFGEPDLTQGRSCPDAARREDAKEISRMETTKAQRHRAKKLVRPPLAGHSRWIDRRRVWGPSLQDGSTHPVGPVPSPGVASASAEGRATSGSQPNRSQSQEVAPRFLTGRPSNVVITTFITRNFSRGPWTNAVQGPKLFKIFISGFPKDAYKYNWCPRRCCRRTFFSSDTI